MQWLQVFCAFLLSSHLLLAVTPPMTPVPLATSVDEWESQRAFFKEHGYLWIKDFFSQDQARLLNSWAEEINASSQQILSLTKSSGVSLQSLMAALPGHLIIVPEATHPDLVCRAEDLCSCFPNLFSFITGTVTEYIGRLLKEPYALYKDKINFKWPGGGAFLPHQDYPAYQHLAASGHVTAMIAIDPATLENGCLQVAKQWRETFAHDITLDAADLSAGRATLPYIQGGKEHGSIQPAYCAQITWIPLETSPRDLVLIDSFIP